MTRTIEEIKADILKYYEENIDEFNENIVELDGYNGYLGDDRYYDMSMFDECMNGLTPSEIACRVAYGDFNPAHDYFRFNGYGNLESDYSEDYSEHLNHWAIESMLDNRYELNLSDELEELFDEYEQATEEQ